MARTVTNSPINLDTRPLPAGWSSHFDSQRKTWYYIQYSASPARVSYIHPLGPNLASLGPTSLDHPVVSSSSSNATSLYNSSSTVQSSVQTNNSSRLSFAQQLYASSIKTPSLPAPSVNTNDSSRSPSAIPSPSVANFSAPVEDTATVIIPPQRRDNDQSPVQPAIPTPSLPMPPRALSDVGSPGNRGSSSSSSASHSAHAISRYPQSRPRGARTPSVSVRSTSSQRVASLPIPAAATTLSEQVPTTLHRHDPIPPHDTPRRTHSYQVAPLQPLSTVQEPRRRHQRAATFPVEIPESSKTSYPSQPLRDFPAPISAQPKSDRQSVSYSPAPPVRTIHTQAAPPPGSNRSGGSSVFSPTSYPSSPMYTSPIACTSTPGQGSTMTAYPFPPTSQPSVPPSYSSPAGSIAPTLQSPIVSVPTHPPVTEGPSSPGSTNGANKASTLLQTTGKAVGSPTGKAVGKVAGRVAIKLVGGALGSLIGGDTITDAIDSGVSAVASAISDSDAVVDGVASLATEVNSSGDFSADSDYLSQMQTIMQPVSQIQINQGQATDYQSMLLELQKQQNLANAQQQQVIYNTKIEEMQNVMNAQSVQMQQVQGVVNLTQPQQNMQTQNVYNVQQQHHQATQNMYNTLLQQQQLLSQNAIPQFNLNAGSTNQPNPLSPPNTGSAVVHPGFGQPAAPGTGPQYLPQTGSVSTPGVTAVPIYYQPTVTSMSTAPQQQQAQGPSTTSQLLDGALSFGRVAMEVTNMMESPNDASYMSTVDTSYTYEPPMEA